MYTFNCAGILGFFLWTLDENVDSGLMVIDYELDNLTLDPDAINVTEKIDDSLLTKIEETKRDKVVQKCFRPLLKFLCLIAIN